MGEPSLRLIPSAVPPGYGGEGRPYAYHPEYFVTKAVNGPPSIMLATAVTSPVHQEGYWPHVADEANNQYLHSVVSAQAPAIVMRGANRVKPGSRVYFKGPQYYQAVKAPSINDVQQFMAARGPLG